PPQPSSCLRCRTSSYPPKKKKPATSSAPPPPYPQSTNHSLVTTHHSPAITHHSPVTTHLQACAISGTSSARTGSCVGSAIKRHCSSPTRLFATHTNRSWPRVCGRSTC